MRHALALSLLAVGAACADSPRLTRRTCEHELVHAAPATAEVRLEVETAGGEAWARAMRWDARRGVFTTQTRSAPGWNAYRFVVDGAAELDRHNPLTLIGTDGHERSAIEADDCSAPGLIVEQAVVEASRGLFTVRFLGAERGAALDARSVRVHLDGATLRDGVHIMKDGTLALTTHALDLGKHRLQVSAADVDGRAAEPLVIPFWNEAQAFDWRDALIYQVVVDRFRRGDGALDAEAGPRAYHGGDLDGVTAAIEEGYFEALGVDALWLSPLYDNPEGTFVGRDGLPAQAYHGYWPSAAREVEERFGGAAALERLVHAAHARGMRVIADVVLNHVHAEHPYFLRHAQDGWFNEVGGDCICGVSCSWSERMESCWFDPFLPDLRWERRDVVQQLVDDAAYWVERFDVDGLRVDAVPMMPRRAVRHLRHALRERFGGAGLEVYLLGETYTHHDGRPQIRYYLGEDALTGQFDFPLMWAMRDALAGRATMATLGEEMVASAEAWTASSAVMAPILGNHDVPRFVSDVADEPVWSPRDHTPEQPHAAEPYERLTVAWAALLTQPGAPVIYYGDEIGLAGATDPDNRRDMVFEPDLLGHQRDLLETVRALGRARRCSPALRRGELRVLVAEENLLVYLRDAGDGAPALVALSRAPLPRTLTIRIPADVTWVAPRALHDAMGAPVAVHEDLVSLTLAPRSGAVLLADTPCARKEST